jgi:lipoate-protein ligase A
MAKIGNYTYKVPNGKLLKVTVEFQERRIEKVAIKGDFFIHPEESLDELEIRLRGVEYERKAISDIVGQYFEKEGLIAFGITPKAVVDTIMKCREVGE